MYENYKSKSCFFEVMPEICTCFSSPDSGVGLQALGFSRAVRRVFERGFSQMAAQCQTFLLDHYFLTLSLVLQQGKAQPPFPTMPLNWYIKRPWIEAIFLSALSYRKLSRPHKSLHSMSELTLEISWQVTMFKDFMLGLTNFWSSRDQPGRNLVCTYLVVQNFWAPQGESKP